MYKLRTLHASVCAAEASVERFLRDVSWLLTFLGMDIVRRYGGCCVMISICAWSPLPFLIPEMEKLKLLSTLAWSHSQKSRS